jgi:hypothetical protein
LATQEGAVKMATKSENNIAALAAMFPTAFSAETWQEHRPLRRITRTQSRSIADTNLVRAT